MIEVGQKYKILDEFDFGYTSMYSTGSIFTVKEVMDEDGYDENGLCLTQSEIRDGIVELVEEDLSDVPVTKRWVKIENPEDIKKYSVGTRVRINGVETKITYHYEECDNGFKIDRKVKIKGYPSGTNIFPDSAWMQAVIVEVWKESELSFYEIPVTEYPQEDIVKKPNHYQLLPEYEVKDINKALLNKIEESSFDISLYEAGWYQQSMQYFMRFYAKNGLEDLEKGIETMQFVVDSMKKRKENE